MHPVFSSSIIPPKGSLCALIAAVVLYAVAGRPTPQSVGIVELSLALTWIVGLGWFNFLAPGIGAGFSARTSVDVWGALSLAWMLVIPSVVGIGYGWDTADIIRDVIPMLFMFVPIAMRSSERWTVSFISYAVAGIGIGFSCRWWLATNIDFFQTWQMTRIEGDDYLLNSPAVIFTAVWAFVYGVHRLEASPSFRRWVELLVWMGVSVVCLAPLGALAHRSALGLVGIAYLVYGVFLMRRRPILGANLLLVVGFFAWAQGSFLGEIIELVWAKTQTVGLNARWEEWDAILTLLLDQPTNFFWGLGWGALIANPAVGLWHVSYTHSFISYLLLKSGVIGTSLILFYLGALVSRWPRMWISYPVTAVALIAPLITALFFHTSFKYLETWVLLGLLALPLERKSCQRS